MFPEDLIDSASATRVANVEIPRPFLRIPYAEAMSVIECAAVNAVTTTNSERKRRNGITRQNRNSR